MWTGVANIYISCSEDGGALSFCPVRYVVTVDDFGKAPDFVFVPEKIVMYYAVPLSSWALTKFVCVQMLRVTYCYAAPTVWRMEYCLTLWLPSVYTEFIKYTCYILWAGQLSRFSDWLLAGRSGDRIPVGARFSARLDRPGAHPASCTMVTGSFPGVKCGRGVLLTTHPLLAPRSWKSRAIPLPPSGPQLGL